MQTHANYDHQWTSKYVIVSFRVAIIVNSTPGWRSSSQGLYGRTKDDEEGPGLTC